MDRTDRFTFMPGNLVKVTDPDELERIYQRTGRRPLPAEERAWIAEQWRIRWNNGNPVSTFELQREYDQLKAEGKL